MQTSRAATTNHHQWPWRYSLYYGRSKVGFSLGLAFFDTALSGYALAGIVAFAATGGFPTFWAWVTGIGGFVFATAIYLAAQYVTFMASGHSETIAASRGDKSLFGPRARLSANSKILMILTQYDVGLSIFCIVYMIGTDVYGVFRWLWRGGLPDNLPQFLVGCLICGLLVSLTFGFAYTGVPKGMKVIEYAYHERDRDTGEGQAAQQAAAKAGYTISPTTTAAASPPRTPGAPALPKRQNPPLLGGPKGGNGTPPTSGGNPTKVINPRQMLASRTLAQHGETPDDDEDEWRVIR